MSSRAAVARESIELQAETTRLMIRAAVVVLSVTAVIGFLTLPITPAPAGPVALSATIVAVIVGWRQTTRSRPDALPFLLIWETLTGLAGSFADGPVANAQTMSLFAAVFMGVFLLEGRRMWIVLGYAWIVLGWMMSRIAPGLDGETVVQIGINHVITLVIGTALMLTLRRRMRYVVERAVARFHTLPVGAFRTTADGVILDANSRLATILGFDSVDDLMTHNAKEFFVDEEQRAGIVAEVARAGSVQGVTLQLHRNGGGAIEARGTLTATAPPSGAVVLEGTIEDITALTSATRRAQMAEDRFTTAFESAPIGMMMVSIDGGFLRANQAIRTLLGYECDQLKAMDWTALGDGSREWDALLNGDGAESHHRISRADGTEIWVLTTAARVEDERGPFLIAQLVDVTSQRTLQDSLRGMVKAKDEFIASVSHELRTPLTAVVGFSDMLINDQSLSGEEALAMQRLVHSQAMSVSHIVDDLLVAARVNNGRLTVSPRLIDVESVARQAVADCAHARGKTASVFVEGTARAWADPERVRQILRNLLTNAFRYGGDRVTVRMSNGGTRAVVGVVDDGDGIDPMDIETIWEPYGRAHPQSSTKTDSIGLGLAVSRQLAELMDGDLTYRYGSGLCIFELTLPAPELAVAR